MKINLFQSLEKHGYSAGVISIKHLDSVKENIESNHRKGLFDEEFYQERLIGFTFNPPKSLVETRSVIVIAVRQPQIRLIFTWKGKRIPVIVPPTYLHWQDTDKQAEKTLQETLEAEGYRVVKAFLPNKPLAVYSGLARYGRNNITYVSGMGSFHRLVAFYSDLPWDGNWQELRMMERCQNCQVCVLYCPSSAISTERFLLRAERCIVFQNEKPGNIPFPRWLESSWHNCLVGCMHCQRVCPENRDFLEWIEDGMEFSSEETMFLLSGTPLYKFSVETIKKLEKSDLLDLIDLFPRNLQALLEGIK